MGKGVAVNRKQTRDCTARTKNYRSRIHAVREGSAGRWPAVLGGPPGTSGSCFCHRLSV